METIAHAWRRIETWLHTFAPGSAALLQPGATPEEIADAETRLGVALPEDVKASYRLHNGVADPYWYWGHKPKYFCSLQSMVAQWEAEKQNPWWSQSPAEWVREPNHYPSHYLSQPVQPVYWHPAWLPFFITSWESDKVCLDLAPVPGGHVGQILLWSHEIGPVGVPFTSFEELLTTYADQVEAGIFVVAQPLLYPRGDWYVNAGRMPFDALKQRHAAFQRPSPAKPALLRAIRNGWSWDAGSPRRGYYADFNQAVHGCLAMYRTVFRKSEATQEDRFFAYYGLAALYRNFQESIDIEEDPRNLAELEQWQAEAATMPSDHWVHDDVAMWQQDILYW